MTEEEREAAFVENLRKYEHRWVAIHGPEGSETIVGSGSNAVEAVREAESKGYHDTVLFKVLPFDKVYVPLADLSRLTTSNLPR
jgi:hypothetical protein